MSSGSVVPKTFYWPVVPVNGQSSAQLLKYPRAYSPNAAAPPNKVKPAAKTNFFVLFIYTSAMSEKANSLPNIPLLHHSHSTARPSRRWVNGCDSGVAPVSCRDGGPMRAQQVAPLPRGSRRRDEWRRRD